MEEKRVRVWVQRFKDRGVLQLQWVDRETGRRRTRSAGTADPEKAEAARVDLEADLNSGRYAEAARLPWAAFREFFEDEYAAPLRENTRRNYRVTLDLFEQVCNPKTLRQVSERTVSAFAAGLRKLPGTHGENQKPGTVKVRLQFLHTVLTWAADQKLIPACPRFPSVKVPRTRPQPVPTESFEKLLAKAPDDHMRAFLLCGWLAGLRLREALRLEWEETDEAPWTDFARDRIVLPARLVKAVEDQWVPMDPDLRAALEALPRQGGRVFHFVREDGRPAADITVSARVRRLAREAGVKLTMKSLRRGFGCRYAARVPAQVLQRLMRHANIKTTMDYYANVDEAAMEAVLGRKRNGLRNSGEPRPSVGAPRNEESPTPPSTSG
jgi:integrase